MAESLLVAPLITLALTYAAKARQRMFAGPAAPFRRNRFPAPRADRSTNNAHAHPFRRQNCPMEMMMTRPRPNRLSPLFLVCALACSALPATTAQDLDRLKQNTDRWIEIRSRTAQEKAQWDTDKQLLSETIKTLQSSQQAVEQRSAHFESTYRDLAEQTQAAQAKVEGFEAANGFLTDHIRTYESRIQTLAQRLPQPLLDQLRPLLAKIPSEAERETIPAPNRLQNVVAIMTLIDEFNNQITLAHTIKTLDNGESIEVRVLYWGLAAAFASDAEGSRAWKLQPEADAWRWSEADSDAPLIKRLFDVYDKRVDPAIVSVPFQFPAQEAGL